MQAHKEDKNDDEKDFLNSENAKQFKKGFEESLSNTFQEMFGPGYAKNPAALFTLDRINKELYAKKPAELPLDLIEAVSKYNLKEHQKIIKSWMVKTKDKNAVDEKGNTLLHIAARLGKTNLVTWFLQQGLDVNACNDLGDSPLIRAIFEAEKNKANLTLRRKLLGTIKALLAAGAQNVVMRNAFIIKSALCFASLLGDLEIVKILIEHGYNVNEWDLKSPLWQAEHSTSRNEEIINLLKEKGAVLDKNETVAFSAETPIFKNS